MITFSQNVQNRKIYNTESRWVVATGQERLGVTANWFKVSFCDKVKVKSLSRAWLFCEAMDSSLHQAPPSMGFSRQEVLDWVAISFSGETSQPRDQTQVSHIVDRYFTVWATREVLW